MSKVGEHMNFVHARMLKKQISMLLSARHCCVSKRFTGAVDIEGCYDMLQLFKKVQEFRYSSKMRYYFRIPFFKMFFFKHH